MEVIEPILLDFGTFGFWRGVDSRHSFGQVPKNPRSKKRENAKMHEQQESQISRCHERAASKIESRAAGSAMSVTYET